ncbi:TPA: hypothetical protein DF272_05850 [Candidatus Falkowbacteria bacterium]|nr:hypothetical protein [Candidatus Falkowbacteria bacterium]
MRKFLPIPLLILGVILAIRLNAQTFDSSECAEQINFHVKSVVALSASTEKQSYDCVQLISTLQQMYRHTQSLQLLKMEPTCAEHLNDLHPAEQTILDHQFQLIALAAAKRCCWAYSLILSMAEGMDQNQEDYDETFITMIKQKMRSECSDFDSDSESASDSDFIEYELTVTVTKPIEAPAAVPFAPECDLNDKDKTVLPCLTAAEHQGYCQNHTCFPLCAAEQEFNCWQVDPEQPRFISQKHFDRDY